MKAFEEIERFKRFGSILGLERISELMSRLGNPQDDFRIIHIAGTNGKGSVSRFIYEAMETAGYRVGIFTSPYLEKFNERIEFDRREIDDDSIERITSKILKVVEQMTEEGYDSPTEFEVVTALAFLYFKEVGADWLILEVGLGGCGDSTNIIKHPAATVFTSISYDHMDRLGDTIQKIATEKAGILKRGSVAVLGIENDVAHDVVRKRAELLDNDVVEVEDIEYTIDKVDLDGSRIRVKLPGSNAESGEENAVLPLHIGMCGEFQIQNGLVAIATLEKLRFDRKIKISDEDLKKAMLNARNMGRFEVLHKNPYVILDGAHNEAGAAALVETIKECLPGANILFVTGVLKDKEYKKITCHLKEVSRAFIATEPENERKLDCRELAKVIAEDDVDVLAEKDIVKACRMAMSMKTEYDAVIFAGSLYLVGKVRKILKGWKNEEKK